MNKLDLESKDMISNNIELISQLFPHCITEQDGKKVVDFNKLKDEFTDEIVDEEKEKYELNWPGKRAAINEARIKTNKTLLPLEEKSVDFEDTNNVYIEGDNLEVLKLLQESYLNKIKCIYIDPPYNTGKDFIYKDDFKQSSEEELIESGQMDEDGNKFVQNTETNGRYHSDWLTMMYPRLKLARNLLKEDGVIFISIDDNEYDNLKKICDEIFGEKNFVSNIIVHSNPRGRQSKADIAISHENLLIYTKEISKVYIHGLELTESQKKEYNKIDENGSFRDIGLRLRGGRATAVESPSLHFPIFFNKDTLAFSLEKTEYFSQEIIPQFSNGILGTWRWSREKIKKDKDYLYIREVGDKFDIFQKDYITSEKRRKHKSLWSEKKFNYDNSARELGILFNEKIFDYAKPVSMIKHIINMSLNFGDIVLDFFSGSSTTAHATMQLNAKDNGNRKYIMVQLPESIDEKNSKAAYDFCIENDLEPIIPSIAQERIKRAGAKIKEETGADIDYGFRVFKLSDSILKVNEVFPSDLQQDLLSESDSKYVDGVSKLDIVTSVILDLGLMLDSKIESIGNDNFIVEEDLLFISLSEEYDNSVLDSIRDIMPDQVVLDEKTFGGNDALMTNVIQQINEINSDITINIL